MTNYSRDSRDVRVDLFKPSGKWSRDIVIKWTQYSGGLITDLFRQYLKAANVPAGYWAVCLEPHHENAYPLMIFTE